MEEFIFLNLGFLEAAGMASTLLPIISGALDKRKTEELGLLHWFFILSFCTEILLIIAAWVDGNNHWLLHAFTLVEFCAYSWVIRSFIKDPFKRKIILIAFPAYISFWILSHIFLEDLFTFDTVSVTVEALLLICFAAMLLFETVNDRYPVPVHRQKRFWLAVGVLVYFLGTLPLFAMANFIVEHFTAEQGNRLWRINHVFGIVSNILFSMVFISRR